jgi:hypothetical protein
MPAGTNMALLPMALFQMLLEENGQSQRSRHAGAAADAHAEKAASANTRNAGALHMVSPRPRASAP